MVKSLTWWCAGLWVEKWWRASRSCNESHCNERKEDQKKKKKKKHTKQGGGGGCVWCVVAPRDEDVECNQENGVCFFLVALLHFVFCLTCSIKPNYLDRIICVFAYKCCDVCVCTQGLTLSLEATTNKKIKTKQDMQKKGVWKFESVSVCGKKNIWSINKFCLFFPPLFECPFFASLCVTINLRGRSNCVGLIMKKKKGRPDKSKNSILCVSYRCR